MTSFHLFSYGIYRYIMQLCVNFLKTKIPLFFLLVKCLPTLYIITIMSTGRKETPSLMCVYVFFSPFFCFCPHLLFEFERWIENIVEQDEKYDLFV